MMDDGHLVGVFDSGVGGLSVLREIHKLLPAQPVIYLADQANVPYGVRQLEEVRAFAHGISRYLLQQGARLIVVACNTASVAALRTLREEFAPLPFVGMEPAVKPAVEQSQTGRVGVLATEATFHTSMYASVVERFAQGVTLYEDPCPGLVAQVEKGDLSGTETRKILERALTPMMDKGVDTIVMGCTHYPFVIPLIKSIVGETVRVIDPAPAIARQTRRVLEANGWLVEHGPEIPPRFVTTGNTGHFEEMLRLLLGQEYPAEGARWSAGKIIGKQ